jgi:hypothetical protein
MPIRDFLTLAHVTPTDAGLLALAFTFGLALGARWGLGRREARRRGR